MTAGTFNLGSKINTHSRAYFGINMDTMPAVRQEVNLPGM